MLRNNFLPFKLFQLFSIMMIFHSCSKDKNQVILFEDHIRQFTIDQKLIEGSSIFFFLHADGCGGCLTAIEWQLKRVDSRNRLGVILVTDSKLSFNEFRSKISNVKSFHDPSGVSYNFINQMESLHYIIYKEPDRLRFQPITPQNLEEVLKEFEEKIGEL